ESPADGEYKERCRIGRCVLTVDRGERRGANLTLSIPGPLGTITTLMRYWIKGRFTRGAILGLVIGEAFSIVFILFGSSTYLSFSSRVRLSSGLSEVALSLLLALFLVGLIQSGFNGSGLAV